MYYKILMILYLNCDKYGYLDGVTKDIDNDLFDRKWKDYRM